MKTRFFSLLAALAFLFISASSPDQGYKIGDTATDFKLRNTDSRFVSLKDYRKAKGFIVAFTCNECPYAKLYEDRLIALHQKYAPLGYPVVAINPNDPSASPDDSFELMKERAKSKKFPFAYLADADQTVTKAYGATRTPHLYILAKADDKLIVKYIGAIDDNSRDATNVTKRYAENALTEIMAGKPVTVTHTKAVGCTIKWRES